MTTLLYTDPHLGCVRHSHTTIASRKALQTQLYLSALDIVRTDDCKKICLGDLFDKYSNPEEIIDQGRDVLALTDLVVAGNHDVVAREDKLGSLEFLMGQFGSRISLAPFGHTLYTVRGLDEDGVFIAVPHHTTQSLFEAALEGARQEAGKIKALERTVYLLLHCNYETPFADTETTLNLTSVKAEKLLETFDRIFIGHEHIPRDLHGGRVMIIGNTHPTSFADISDKFVISIKGGTVQRELIWKASDHYVQLTAEELLKNQASGLDPVIDTEGLEFIRITGEVTAAEQVAISKLVTQLWRADPEIFAINLDTQIKDDSKSVVKMGAGTLETLPQRIERELADSPWLPLWKEFTAGETA